MRDKVTYGIARGPTAPGVLVSVCRPQHISKRQATIKAWERGYNLHTQSWDMSSTRIYNMSAAHVFGHMRDMVSDRMCPV